MYFQGDGPYIEPDGMGTMIAFVDYLCSFITLAWASGHIASSQFLYYSIFALSLVIIACSLMLWSFLTLSSNYPNICTRGPYYFVRHPWYFADVLVIVATLPVIDSGIRGEDPVTGFLTIFLILFDICGIVGIIGRIIEEEEFLIQYFGSIYRPYKSKTACLIPYLF